jgi:hypothetical protein
MTLWNAAALGCADLQGTAHGQNGIDAASNSFPFVFLGVLCGFMGFAFRSAFISVNLRQVLFY